MKALQRVVWSVIFLVWRAHGECGGAGKSLVQQRIEEDLGQIPRGVEVRWKRMLHWGNCEWEWDESAFCKEEKEKRNSQGEDPRTCEENSQGGDFSTPQTDSQRKDPKKKKKKVKCRERTWWEKCKEKIVSLFTARMKEDEKEKKKAEKETDVPERDKHWRSLEDGPFSFCFLGRIV